MKKILCFYSLLLFFVFGCSSDKEDADFLTFSSETAVYFEKGMDFTSESGSRNISFKTGGPWRILLIGADSHAVDWCTVSSASGSGGDASVSVNVKENTGYDSRSVKLVLTTGGNIEKNLVITQKQKDALTLTSSHFEVPKEGKKIVVEVKANIDFEVEIPEAHRSWISQVKTRGLVSTELTFDIAPNEGVWDREGEIIIKSGSLSEKLKVVQAGSMAGGLSHHPESPDADKELTVSFKAPAGTPLYGYAGDVYIHAGVLDEGTWLYVPAGWNDNLDKCKMTRVGENVWSITLKPSVRAWFGSGETPVTKLGVVIRSADGTKKGIENDSFIEVTDTKYTAFEPADIRYAPLPSGVREGINVINSGTVTLVLYDKTLSGSHKDFAHVVGDFNQWKLSNEEGCQMRRDDAKGCWWITLSGLDAAKEYAFQYYVGMKGGERIRLGDPYCEKILDPDHDKDIAASTYPESRNYPEGARGIVSVFKIQKDEYHWSVPDFKIKDAGSLVVYEMLLRDFTSTGDINGAMQKLDYLKTLGVNAVELMPVQEFDGNNSWGYNPCYYFALDKAYGTKQMYKQFIDACHRRGMAVILDVVYNHATGNHPFAKLYWDAAKNKTLPDNPWFNVDAPHPYSVFHDFNHESPLVRAFVKRNLEFLLTEYKFDGFRFDLSKGFTQQSSTEATAAKKDDSRIAILTDYYHTVHAANPHAVMILEHFCDEEEETALANAGMKLWHNMNGRYCQSAMGWKEDSSFEAMRNNGRPAGSMISFMESHDEERMGYKQLAYGNGALKDRLPARMNQLASNAAFFLTVSGPKMIWQFGELGYDFSINSRPDGVVGDEGNRMDPKPVRWDYVEQPDRKALYEVYCKLMKLRNGYPDLFGTNAFKQWRVGENDWTAGRFMKLESTTRKLVVVANFSQEQTEVNADFGHTGTWYELRGDRLNVTSSTQNVKVPAHEFRLYTSFE